MDRVHLDDLAAPRMPLPIRVANAVPAALVRRWTSLDEASVLEAARTRTGLHDFGDDRFREPLRVFLRSLEQEAHLSNFGRFAVRGLVVQLLCNRLLIEDRIRRHPELLDVPIERPIIIAGLPRTGTTHLHNLISADPAMRSLPFWESLEPVPMTGEHATEDPTQDPRYRRADRALRFQDWMMPHFKRMHEMTPDAIHEEIQLLAIDFSTMLLETGYDTPSYQTWYMATDQADTYRYLYRVLQVLQSLRGKGRRWILKSPQHLEQLGPLMRVFPDAMVIQTHRDPVRITASLSTMVAYSMRINARCVDPHAIGRKWARRIEDMLRGSIEGRVHVPEDQRMDVHFAEFMKDDIAMVKRVYAFADQPWSEEADGAIRDYLEANPRGKHGTVDYRLEDVGLDADERRQALRFYSDYFGVAPEG